MFTIYGGAPMYRSIEFFKFQKMFSTEKKCWNFLVKKRWPNGYECPRCTHQQYYFHPKRLLFECRQCRYQVSVIANTIFHKTRTTLKKWFWAIFLMVYQKNGISALQLQKFLQIKTYKTVWAMVHKIRKAMADRDSAYQLQGLIELDDSYFGGKQHSGKRGRGSENKRPVLVGVEVPDNKRPKFAWLHEVPTLESHHIENILKKKVKTLSTLKTDANKGFLFIPGKGFYHYPKKMDDKEKLATHLPWVHTLVGNVKNALLATFHGVSGKHLQRYLDEAMYLFNRRFWESQLFDRLLNACLITNTITFSELRQ